MKGPGIQKIALGTAQFGSAYGATNKDGQISLGKASAILGMATRHGVDTVDTAIGYGESEEILGKAGVKNFKVVTKLPAVPDGERFVARWMEDQIRNSLKRLCLEKVHGVLLHRPTELTGMNGPRIFDSLLALQKEGLAEKIGVSVYHPEDLEISLGKWPFTIVQAPFNLLDRRLARSGWLVRLTDRQVELHVRSVFLQGLLLQPANQRPAPFARRPELWEKWQAWLRHYRLDPVDACLAFVQSHPGITRVIVGVDNPLQWESILSSPALSGEIPWPDIETEDEELILPYLWPKQVPAAVA
ncbi:aldo/keto reductase [bacterium]|nr:aldo/keto reductase [bacterium]